MVFLIGQYTNRCFSGCYSTSTNVEEQSSHVQTYYWRARRPVSARASSTSKYVWNRLAFLTFTITPARRHWELMCLHFLCPQWLTKMERLWGWCQCRCPFRCLSTFQCQCIYTHSTHLFHWGYLYRYVIFIIESFDLCYNLELIYNFMLFMSRCLFPWSSLDFKTLLKRKTLNVACLLRAQWKTMRWRKEKTSLRY